MKPIGYYVSVPEGHDDYETLNFLESYYGSYLENILLSDLWGMLRHCSVAIPNPELPHRFLVKLSRESCFNLIPFLHQVIKERIRNAN